MEVQWGFNLATLAGLSGVLLNVLWPLLRDRRAMLTSQAIAGVLFVIHYAIIGAPTGSVMNALAALQALAAIPLGTRPGFRLVYLATLPAVALGVVFTWTGLPSVFAALAMAGISLGRYQLNVMHFRVILLVTIPLWIAHNLLVGSVPGLLSDTLVSASSIVGLRRLVRERRLADQVA